MGSKTIRDPIHNNIILDEAEVAIADTPMFQRLRWISQLSGVRMVYPSGTHNRLAHSMGVMHIAGLYAEKLFEGEPDAREKVKTARMAALVHDIGHSAFSHQFDDIVYKRIYPNVAHGHDAHRDIIMSSSPLSDILGDFGFSPSDLSAVWSGDSPLLHSIVQGALGADRLDFMLRDSYFCGSTHFGSLPIRRLIDNTIISDHDGSPSVHYRFKILDDIYSVLIGRFFLYKTIYFHKTSRAADILIQQMLEASIEPLDLITRTKDLDSFTELNEYSLMGEIMSSTDPAIEPARLAARRLFNRILPKAVYEGIYTDPQIGMEIDLYKLSREAAQNEFISKINSFFEARNEPLPKLTTDITYHLSTISSDEFDVSRVYIFSNSSRNRPVDRSLTLQEALSETRYIRGFSGDPTSSSKFIITRVYADPDDADRVTSAWSEIFKSKSTRKRDVSTTSY